MLLVMLLLPTRRRAGGWGEEEVKGKVAVLISRFARVFSVVRKAVWLDPIVSVHRAAVSAPIARSRTTQQVSEGRTEGGTGWKEPDERERREGG